MLDDPMRYKLLSLLEDNPELSQRDLARKLGMSLGKTNYCLKGLVEKGWIKIQNFRNSRNKRAYLYQLTPAGIKEKAQVTRRFLALKMKEHAEITYQIEQLRQEVQSSRQKFPDRGSGD
jgi:EPS-associated MarR family transcriptional regulator